MRLEHKATWHDVDRAGHPRTKDRDTACLVDTDEFGLMYELACFVKNRWVWFSNQEKELKVKVLRYLKLEELEQELTNIKADLAEARQRGQVPREH